LLNETVPSDELEKLVMERARQLAYSATSALGAIKINLNAAIERPFAEALANRGRELFTQHIDCRASRGGAGISGKTPPAISSGVNVSACADVRCPLVVTARC
jgi:enoyl-CoA hydratase/carnithine racemase